MKKRLLLIVITLIVVAIVLGASGAHALKGKISAERLQSFEVGIRYQFYNALALLVILLNEDKFPFSLKAFYNLILAGTMCFSFSIYLLSTQYFLGLENVLRFLGPITPLGGLLLIIGWMFLFIKVLRSKD